MISNARCEHGRPWASPPWTDGGWARGAYAEGHLGSPPFYAFLQPLPFESGLRPGIQPGFRAQIPAPSLPVCVTPEKPLDFSEPWAPPLENGHNEPYLAGLRLRENAGVVRKGQVRSRCGVRGELPVVPSFNSGSLWASVRLRTHRQSPFPPETLSEGTQLLTVLALRFLCPVQGRAGPPAHCPSESPLLQGQGWPRRSAG